MVGDELRKVSKEGDELIGIQYGMAGELHSIVLGVMS
jgi:hypothetical protein